MTQKKSKPIETAPVPVVPDEDWTVAQVASHMTLSYQTARNQMLQGIFGTSKYDAEKRRLTVSANQVKRVKTNAGKRSKKKLKKHAKTAKKSTPPV
jgi:hypothetical protein